MFRVIFGVILIGIGIYFGLEADNGLDAGLLRLGANLTPDLEIPGRVTESMNNVVVDISSKLGAETYSEMEDYLSFTRIACIVLGVIGILFIASKIFQRG